MRAKADESTQRRTSPEPVPEKFDGETFERDKDGKRLGTQFLKVRRLMLDGVWRTLDEIAQATGYPEASISARLRDLRKPRFGSYDVQRRRRTTGTHEYRVATQRPVKQCPKCGEWIATKGDAVRSHLKPHYANGCGYCLHEDVSIEKRDGERFWKCNVCKREERSQLRLFE